MYKLYYLPIARQDVEDIIHYVSYNLNNLSAAKNLANYFVESAENVLCFPYGFSVYDISGELKKEYRKIKVKNYYMFYTIDEDSKTIIIVRVIYKKMNLIDIFKSEVQNFFTFSSVFLIAILRSLR